MLATDLASTPPRELRTLGSEIIGELTKNRLRRTRRRIPTAATPLLQENANAGHPAIAEILKSACVMRKVLKCAIFKTRRGGACGAAGRGRWDTRTLGRVRPRKPPIGLIRSFCHPSGVICQPMGTVNYWELVNPWERVRLLTYPLECAPGPPERK